MLNPAEHEIYPAHEYYKTNNCWHFNFYKQDEYSSWKFKSKKNLIFLAF